VGIDGGMGRCVQYVLSQRSSSFAIEAGEIRNIFLGETDELTVHSQSRCGTYHELSCLTSIFHVSSMRRPLDD
jgi:hypothetical protein